MLSQTRSANRVVNSKFLQSLLFFLLNYFNFCRMSHFSMVKIICNYCQLRSGRERHGEWQKRMELEWMVKKSQTAIFAYIFIYVFYMYVCMCLYEFGPRLINEQEAINLDSADFYCPYQTKIMQKCLSSEKSVWRSIRKLCISRCCAKRFDCMYISMYVCIRVYVYECMPCTNITVYMHSFKYLKKYIYLK